MFCHTSHHLCTWPFEKGTRCREPLPTATDLKIHSHHPGRILAVSWASVMRIGDGSRPHLPRLNTGITVVLIHSSRLTKQTAGVRRGFETWKMSGQAQGKPSIQSCLIERKPHLTLHKPSRPGERHWEIKRQWSHPFWHAQSDAFSAGKGKARRERIKGRLEFGIRVEVRLECADKVGSIRKSYNDECRSWFYFKLYYTAVMGSRNASSHWSLSLKRWSQSRSANCSPVFLTEYLESFTV